MTANRLDRRVRPVHVIWDWNGTLLNDTDVMIASVSAAFAAHLSVVVTAHDHRMAFRRPIRAFFETLAGNRLTDRQYNELCAAYNMHYQQSPVGLAPGARSALARCHAIGATVSVCSMAPAEEVMAAMRRLGADHFFGRVGGRVPGEVDLKATHLDRHIRRLGHRRADVLFVGDTFDDCSAALANDVAFVGFRPEGRGLEHEWPTGVDVPTVPSMPAAAEHILSFASISADPPEFPS